MPLLSMNEMTTYRWRFDEDVAAYAEAGYDGIGIWRQKLSDYGEEKGMELLARTGLGVSSLSWAGGFTGSDGRPYKESIEDAHEALRLAGVMQAGTLVLHSGSRANYTFNHAKRIFKDALKSLLPEAERRNVTLVVEPMLAQCAAGWTFFCSLRECVEFIASLENSRLKLVLDTYHFGHDPDLLADLPGMIPYLGIVHLGDSKTPPDAEQNRCPLGEGIVPLKAIVSTLIKAGYDGYFDIELLGEEIEVSNYRDILTQGKRVFQELIAG